MTFQIEYDKKEMFSYSKERAIALSPIPVGKFISSGAYAWVHQSANHPDRVVKVLDIDRDYGYWNFVKVLASLKKQNPFFPVVYRAVVVRFYPKYDDPVRMLFIEMEKLSHEENVCVEVSEDFEMDLYEEIDYIIHAVDWSKTKREKNLRWFVDIVCPEIVKARKTLKKLEKKIQRCHDDGLWGCNDLHSRNVMFRANGEVVITDPMAV
jgi:hypothetical protein